MSGPERRAQLLDIGRAVFAERGYQATSIEEIAKRAAVSKPIVYEHFGGKDGLYEVVVEREIERLLDRITASLDVESPRKMVEQAADGLLTYIEEERDGFRILVRDAPTPTEARRYDRVISDIASQVEYILVEQFRQRGYDPNLAPIYSHALVGMVASVGEWWLDAGKPSRKKVAANLVNLAWNGLSRLEKHPI